MGTVSTSMCSSFKRELAMAAHCFGATVTPTGDLTSGAFAIATVSAVTGIAVGMAISGTGVPASSRIASIDGAAAITISKAATASNNGVTLTIAGDTFNMALVKVSPTGSYGAATTNYSDLTGNSDETSGTGYTAGGVALSANISPALTSTTAFWSWSGNPSWTSASFSAIGCIIYNTTKRLENTANRSISCHDFGGTQTVASGTFTVVLPTNDSSTAILRIT